MNHLDILNEFSYEIDSDIFDDVDTQLYAKIESIRESYNKLILNNQKTIITSEIMIDLKEKFYKMKKVLNEENEDEVQNTSPFATNVSPSSTYHRKNAYHPNANSNTWKDTMSNSNVTNKKYSCINTNKNKSYNEYSINDKDNNQQHNLNINITKTKQMQSTQRDISSRQSLNDSIEKNINNRNNHENINNHENKSSSQIIQIKTEMMILKEDMKRLITMKKDSSNKSNEELVIKLNDENHKTKNDIYGLKNEIDDLRNIISAMNKKINEVIDDNQSLKRHNQSLINYISILTQNKQESSQKINPNLNTNYTYSSPSLYSQYQDLNNKPSSNNNGNKNNSSNTKGEAIDELLNEYISDVNES